VVNTLIAADADVAAAVAATADQIAAAVDLFVAALAAGGTVHYLGSGTSGRMGVLDAVELWPTFRVSDAQVKSHLAGGAEAMVRAAEGAEDDAGAGAAVVAGAGADDLIVGLTASGRTPYVRGALEAARARGLRTVLVSTNPNAPLRELADVAILPDTGPEVLTGSTRLKAATAQKMVLNTLSTASMVRLGKTFSNLMIDMVPSNEKLRARSVRILQQGARVEAGQAAIALDAAGGSMRVALVSLLAGVDAERAAQSVALNPPDPTRQADPSGIRTAVEWLAQT
jgi:N-acetylmuramic acid 6-phosphate etherase